MSFNLNIIKRLKKAGYTELNLDTPTTGKLAHLVYLTNDEEGDRIYFQSTRAIPSAFGLFQRFLRTGKATYLPAPVEHAMTWSKVQFAEQHVKVFYKKNIFVDPTLVKQLAKEFHVVERKPRAVGGATSVLKLSIKGVKGYKLVTTTGTHAKAISNFISSSKALVGATYKVAAVSHREWAIRNQLHLSTANVECQVLAENLLGGAAGVIVRMTMDTEPNKSLLLNHHGVRG